ncbi:MAG: hypothetical protein AB1726_04230 [Planctomycetota bacterium]
MPADADRRSVLRVLIPAHPRSFPGQRGLKVLLRGVHVLGAGVYAGAIVLDVAPAARPPWLLAALGTGLLLLAFDLYETGAFLLQMRGVVVLAKLLLLGVAPFLGAAAPWVLGAVVVGSVISSHASSGFRYFLVWGRGRIEGARTKG